MSGVWKSPFRVRKGRGCCSQGKRGMGWHRYWLGGWRSGGLGGEAEGAVEQFLKGDRLVGGPGGLLPLTIFQDLRE